MNSQTRTVTNVVVVADDTTLLELLKAALEGRQKVWRAEGAEHAVDLLQAQPAAILLVDAARTTHETPQFVDRLHERFPDLPIVVAGRRDDELELGERISTGVVFRFLHKPVSADRIRNFLENAARRAAERPPPKPVPQKAEFNALDAARAIKLPTVEVDTVAIGRVARKVALVALLGLAAWGVVEGLKWKPWEKVVLPELPISISMPKPAADGPVLTAAEQRQADLSRLLREADEALAAGRLAEPEGRNAIELYRRVLLLDASNAVASEGLAQVAQQLLVEMEARVAAQDLAGAAVALDAARAADPSNPQLEAASTRLAEERERARTASVAGLRGGVAPDPAVTARVERLLLLADEAMAAGQLADTDESAEAYVQEARRLRPQDPGVVQAVNALSGRMLLAAGEALDNEDPVTARDWIDRAAALEVDERNVARLRARLEALRRDRLPPELR